MNRKTFIFIILFVSTISIMAQEKQNANALTEIEYNNTDMLENGKTYRLWDTEHISYVTIKRKHRKYGEADRIFVWDYEFIKSLPREAKIIIACYTALTRDWEKETDHEMAQALGGFATLCEAREALSKEWNGCQSVSARNYTIYLRSLQLRKVEQSFFFEYPALHSSGFRTEYMIDEFKMDSAGNITFIPQPEPLEEISYSRKEIREKYAHHTLILNGEKVKNGTFGLYLDANNIEKVTVNKRDHILYITQKNKQPDYFVRADIANHLDSLAAFKVKKLEDIHFIYIKDLQTGYTFEFGNWEKIETSTIVNFTTYVDEGGKGGKYKFNNLVVVVR